MKHLAFNQLEATGISPVGLCPRRGSTLARCRGPRSIKGRAVWRRRETRDGEGGREEEECQVRRFYSTWWTDRRVAGRERERTVGVHEADVTLSRRRIDGWAAGERADRRTGGGRADGRIGEMAYGQTDGRTDRRTTDGRTDGKANWR